MVSVFNTTQCFGQINIFISTNCYTFTSKLTCQAAVCVSSLCSLLSCWLWLLEHVLVIWLQTISMWMARLLKKTTIATILYKAAPTHVLIYTLSSRQAERYMSNQIQHDVHKVPLWMCCLLLVLLYSLQQIILTFIILFHQIWKLKFMCITGKYVTEK